MTTIVEPKKHIDDLWGKQRVKEDAKYRLMKYVLRVDHEGKVLFHNVVTGRLVVLDEAETEALETLPAAYRPEMESLVTEHYLVPEDYDEFQQVKNLRRILQILDETHEPKGIINHYTILPTTACNARCYYCFEQGTKAVTMTKDTADDVVDFIKKHYGGKDVRLSWFGGEPTLAIDRIDQICRGLVSNGISYSSDITTNGYLMDDDNAKKARDLWKLNSAMICVDGTEGSYNRIKCYIYNNANPYQIVMRNIGFLLAQGVFVHLRMNFDVGNYHEFADLVTEVGSRFQGYKNLMVSAHPVLGEYGVSTGSTVHGDDAWFQSKIGELNVIAKEAGLQVEKKILPSLDHVPCLAARNSAVTITAEGSLVSCPEQFGENQWKGNLKDGITNESIVASWKTMASFDKCRDCPSYPHCVVMANCTNAGKCLTREPIVRQQKKTMVELFRACDNIKDCRN